MTEGNGVKITAWNDKAALIRHGCAVLVVAFLAGGVYVALDFRVKAADDRSKDNAAAIKGLKSDIWNLDRQQQVIITNQNNDRRQTETFQEDTKKALDRILNKLDAR